MRWRCEISYWIHGQHLHEQARHHARRAEESWGRGRLAAAVWETIETARFSPKMAWHRLLQPLLAEKGYASLVFLLFKKQGDAAPPFVGKYADNWIGPVYRQQIRLPYPQTRVIVVLEHGAPPAGHRAKIDVGLFIEGRKVAGECRVARGPFNIEAVVERPRDKEFVVLELRTRPYFIPRLLTGAPDDRKLCVRVFETRILPAGTTEKKSANEAVGHLLV